MDAFHELLENYTLESVFIFIVVLIVFIKFVGEALEWIVQKIKVRFNIQSRNDVKHQELSLNIENMNEKFETMEEAFENINNRIDKMNDRFDKIDADIDDKISNIKKILDDNAKESNSAMNMLREQAQQSTKAYIMERHHHFCYTVGAIDDNSLQMLEIRFAYYKSQGGNSFIDRQMEELRALPRISAENAAIVVSPSEGGSL